MKSITHLVKTRYEAEEQMKNGQTFETTSSVSTYNRNMLDFYMSKYNFQRSKIRRGIDLYKPAFMVNKDIVTKKETSK